MCNLSEREKETLEVLLDVADNTVAAAHLGVTPKTIGTYTTRVRRKEAKAKDFLQQLKRYKRILHPETEYKL